jgi:hypothetical protein
VCAKPSGNQTCFSIVFLEASLYPLPIGCRVEVDNKWFVVGGFFFLFSKENICLSFFLWAF